MAAYERRLTSARTAARQYLLENEEEVPRAAKHQAKLESLMIKAGGIVVADNALRGGRVLDPAATDADTEGVRELNRRLATDPRLVSILVPTHDGVAIGVVKDRV